VEGSYLLGGKNRVDLGQLRQVLGYEGTVEQ
jgi:hypothetical protein